MFRGSDYGMFDSASASLAQQNLWKRYGFAEGPPNSEPRQKQVKRLQATGWSVFKKQLANVYHGNTEKWRQWLLDLKEKTNIFQSALATIQLGPHGHLKNFPRPPHFAPEDDSWMNDEELVAWSYQEKARQMRAALPAGFFLRERQQYAALKNGHCNRGAVELFIKVPVWVDPTGRAHFSVKVGDHIYRRADGLTVGAAFAGQVVYLDYDPDKSKDSLVSWSF